MTRVKYKRYIQSVGPRHKSDIINVTHRITPLLGDTIAWHYTLKCVTQQKFVSFSQITKGKLLNKINRLIMLFGTSFREWYLITSNIRYWCAVGGCLSLRESQTSVAATAGQWRRSDRSPATGEKKNTDIFEWAEGKREEITSLEGRTLVAELAGVRGNVW